MKSDSTAATPAAVADTTATAQVKDTTAAVVAKADTAAKPDVLAKVDANAAADKEGDKKLSKEEEEKIKKENPLFALLQPAQGAAGAMVGMAQAKDTAEINRIFRSETAKQILPVDMELKWGVKAIDKAGKVFELYALKSNSNGKAYMEGDVVTSSKDDFNQEGNPVVTMKMNTEGSRKWPLREAEGGSLRVGVSCCCSFFCA